MTIADILTDSRKLKVLIVGDICLDRWCWYDPSLAVASAETRIPRIAVVRTIVTPGAGGTVANNLAALGVSQISVLGTVGQDGYAQELRCALRERGISTDLLIENAGLCTFTYTKLINVTNDVEDLPRLDFINTKALPQAAEREILSALDSNWQTHDLVIVSDQAETENGGVVTASVRQRINEIAESDPQKLIWVDSRKRPELFRSVVMKINVQEAEDACQRRFRAVDFARLQKECGLKLLIVTHGDRGALLIADTTEEWIPARRVTPVDICGAGDSFSAAAACALAVTGSAARAASIGNLAASITVTKKGTGTASPGELLAAAHNIE